MFSLNGNAGLVFLFWGVLGFFNGFFAANILASIRVHTACSAINRNCVINSCHHHIVKVRANALVPWQGQLCGSKFAI